MSSEIARVHYFDRQFLRLDEFVDEQAYHLAAHRRHNLSHHSWGIVSGLALELDEETGQPVVGAGVAVDGYGRDLVLDHPQGVPVATFDELQAEEIAVWLIYYRVGSDRLGEGWAPCGQERSAQGYYREQERPRLITGVPDPDLFDPRAPESVPEGDRPFAPHRTPPDRVTDDWPVYLGRVVRDASDPAAPTYTVDLKGRPYAGAVAARLAPPFDREHPWVLLGGDEESAAAAFELRVPPPEGGEPRTALEIEPGGALTTHGDLSVRGDLEVEGGVVELSVARPDDLAPSPPAGAAQPWRIYRHRQEEAAAGGIDPATGEPTSSPQPVGEQLRVEMGPEDSEVVIGYFSDEDKAFKPCLTVGSDCTVTVHGNLVVEGSIEGLQVAKGTIPAVLSAEAQSFLLANFNSGIAGSNLFLANTPVFNAGGEVPFLRTGSVAERVADMGVAAGVTAGAAAGATAVTPGDLAAALAADTGRRIELADALRHLDPEAAAQLAALLQGEAADSDGAAAAADTGEPSEG